MAEAGRCAICVSAQMSIARPCTLHLVPVLKLQGDSSHRMTDSPGFEVQLVCC